MQQMHDPIPAELQAECEAMHQQRRDMMGSGMMQGASADVPGVMHRGTDHGTSGVMG
jgi:hypothetical protein